MNNTAKTSIAAIIFVMIYFTLILFISLFKGINLYNISLGNIKIEHLFLKIDKKFILKANNINIKVKKKNINKQTFQIHKIIYFSSKLLPLIQEINIKNIYQNNNLIVKHLNINENQLKIESKFIKAKGNFKILKDYTYIHFKNISIQNYKFKDVYLYVWINKNYSFINIKAVYNYPIYLALKINKDDTILSSISISYKKLKFNNINLTLKKCNLYSQLYLPLNTIKAKGNCQKIKIKKDFLVNLYNNKLKFDNKYFEIESNNSKISYKDYNLSLKNLFVLYDIKNNKAMTSSKESNIRYKNYSINNKNLTFNINLKNYNFFLHSNDLNISNDINFSSKEVIAYKTKKLYLLINNNEIKNKYFVFNTKQIKGDEKNIYITDLIGKILTFNSFIKSPSINIPKKRAKSNLISINDINFTNNILSFNKIITFSTTTNTLLNKNVKDILNYFKINIPIIQMQGKNELNTTIEYNKTLYAKYSLNSKNSLFKFKDINFSYQNLNLNGNLNNLTFSLNNLIIPYQYFDSILDSNTTININRKYLNSYLFIKKLNIDKYLQIKNLNDKLVIDLINNFIYLLKSSIFINLNTHTIFFYNLSTLIKYSPFKTLINSGEATIKLYPNKIDTFVNINLNYPLILNSKNPKNIKADINITNNYVKITSNKFNINIRDFNKITAFNHDVNLSVEGLINIIDKLKIVLNKISSNKENNNSTTTAIILAKNTNFIYKNHAFLTNEANLIFNKEVKFNAKYKQSKLRGYTKKGYLLIEGTHYTKKVLVPLLDFFKTFKKIDLDFTLVKSPEDFYIGKVYINKGIVKELATLNNLIAFINTIPSLLSFQSPGFSAKGYKIKKGYISYLYYNNILYFKKIDITGENLDFKGKGYIDLSKNKIKLKIDSILKIKLKKIPIIGKGISYLLFGKDGYLHVKVIIKGDLNNPKIEKDILGNPIETPFKLFKRIITLPFNLF